MLRQMETSLRKLKLYQNCTVLYGLLLKLKQFQNWKKKGLCICYTLIYYIMCLLLLMHSCVSVILLLLLMLYCVFHKEANRAFLPNRTFQRRPQQLLSADGKTLLNLWYIPHFSEVLHMFKTLEVLVRHLNTSLRL